MATDIEEYEGLVHLIYELHKELSVKAPDEPLLAFIRIIPDGFYPTEAFQERYIRPNLRARPGQLFLWDFMYPNQLPERLSGLVDYYRDLKGIEDRLSTVE
jgi:hypothetical protein